MRAAVTVAPGEVTVTEVAEPGQPARDEILLRPLAVGICGSDVHLFHGDTAALSGAEWGLPRIQGHEIGAEVIADPAGRLRPGDRVAVWPLVACGSCHRCAAGAVNACVGLSIIGVHRDGGLAEALTVPATHVFGVGEVSEVAAAFVEPLSIGMHAVARSGARPGDQVVVFGGGAVGQGVCAVLADRDIATFLVERTPERAGAGALWGARTTTEHDRERLRGEVLDWTAGTGADVVMDATGAPAVLDTALDVVRVGGTVVAVGLTAATGSVHTGTIAAKELAVLGSSCCTAPEFEKATALAGRWAGTIDRLPVRRHPLEDCAVALAEAHTAADAVKVLVDITRS
ncbi:zinc-binding dehydrogenase [Streptomyces sp. NPDC021212]|uniref:zinc-binding dehydrogenase n=1 Tax=Streptomyces sp. NPDC021212 TaxID=3365118 RepID=UPI0037B2F3D4